MYTDAPQYKQNSMTNTAVYGQNNEILDITICLENTNALYTESTISQVRLDIQNSLVQIQCIKRGGTAKELEHMDDSTVTDVDENIYNRGWCVLNSKKSETTVNQ